MKKNKFYLLLTMLFAALMLASCSKSVPDYAKLIPNDAPVVIRVDVRQIAKKSGFGDNDKLKKKIEKAIKDNMSGKAKEKILAIVDDPVEAGLDLRDPVFIFYNPESEEGGLVGAVYKEEKFEELLNVLAKEAGADKVKKNGDQYYIAINDVLITFNDDWFYIEPFKGEDSKAAAKEIVKRFESGKKSIVEDEGFIKMCEKNGLAQMYIQGKWLYDYSDEMNQIEYYVDPDDIDPPSYQPENPFDKLKDMLGIDISNFAVIFDLCMDNGEASLSAELAAIKEKGKAQLEDIDKMVGGEKEGFYFRFNFGFIERIAKKLDGYDAKQAKMVAKLLKYAELKYEGDCKMKLRVVTNDDDKTPLQTIFEIAQKEFGL